MYSLGFYFNGKHSNDMGLVIKTESNPLFPKKRIEMETVMGKDGAYTFEGSYNNKTLKFRCVFLESDMITRRLLARNLSEWLSSKGDLILDYEPDKKYIVTQTVNDIDLILENVYDTFSIAFEVMPQQYSVNNQSISLDNPTSQIGIFYSGNYKALPLLEVTGTGNISITTNGKTFTYTGLTGTIYIDCNHCLVYSGNNPKINKLANFSGDFIQLIKGLNAIDLTGTITNIKIKFNNTYI